MCADARPPLPVFYVDVIVIGDFFMLSLKRLDVFTRNVEFIMNLMDKNYSKLSLWLYIWRASADAAEGSLSFNSFPSVP